MDKHIIKNYMKMLYNNHFMLNKKYIKKILLFGIIIPMTVIFITACADNIQINSDPDYDTLSVVIEPEHEEEEEPDPEAAKNPEPAPAEDSEEEPEPVDTGFINPLTGKATWEDISDNRPIGIMINNVRTGLPQQGTSRADIIYEALVEGGLTRTIAIFQDVSIVGAIGSIRSVRPYFVDIAQSHDAIFMHAGGSEEAISIIRNRRLDHIDEIGGPRGSNIFYRDQTRRASLGSEHSLMTSGERITNELAGMGFRLQHNESFIYPILFVEDATPFNGTATAKVTVTFSSAKSTTFVYNADTNRYFIEQYGRPHIDGNDNTQLSVTNVIVIRTVCSVITDDDAGRRQITTEGSGNGYFINGGKYIDIIWKRAKSTDPFSYTLTDGTPLDLGIGRTYVCLIPTNENVKFE